MAVNAILKKLKQEQIFVIGIIIPLKDKQQSRDFFKNQKVIIKDKCGYKALMKNIVHQTKNKCSNYKTYNTT